MRPIFSRKLAILGGGVGSKGVKEDGDTTEKDPRTMMEGSDHSTRERVAEKRGKC